MRIKLRRQSRHWGHRLLLRANIPRDLGVQTSFQRESKKPAKGKLKGPWCLSDITVMGRGVSELGLP